MVKALARLFLTLAMLLGGLAPAAAAPAPVRQVVLQRRATAAAPFTATFQGHNVHSTVASTYQTTAAALGAASADRIVIVAIMCNGATAQTITGVTLAGVTATAAIQAASLSRIGDVWFAQVPTGTTGDLVATTSGNMSRCSFDWWTITGTAQTTYSARSGAAPSVATATSLTLPSITVPSGGFAIAYGYTNDTLSQSATWSQTSGSGTQHTNSMIVSGFAVHTYDSATSGAQAFQMSVGSSVTWRGGSVAWGP